MDCGGPDGAIPGLARTPDCGPGDGPGLETGAPLGKGAEC